MKFQNEFPKSEIPTAIIGELRNRGWSLELSTWRGYDYVVINSCITLVLGSFSMTITNGVIPSISRIIHLEYADPKFNIELIEEIIREISDGGELDL